MSSPSGPPLGLLLARTARIVDRAFDEALADVGASRPVWLTLLAVKTGRGSSQRELAAAIGVHGATLTHHLNAMERDGLLVRRRRIGDRRSHDVELTDAGQALFGVCRTAAVAFDRRLHEHLDPARATALADTLGQLRRNVAPDAPAPQGTLTPSDSTTDPSPV